MRADKLIFITDSLEVTLKNPSVKYGNFSQEPMKKISCPS